MRIIPNIFVATTIAAISYSAIAAPAHAISFSSTTGALNDYDGVNPTATNFTFTVSGVATGAPGYTYSLTINGLTHADLSELEAYLIRGGTTPKTLNLFSLFSPPLSGADLTNTTFIDTGAALSTVAAPYTGNFAPENSTSIEAPDITNFNGFGTDDPNTEWTLRFYDSVNGNVGDLTGATLDITPVPFEFSPTFGLLALGGWIGRKKIASKFKAWRDRNN